MVIPPDLDCLPPLKGEGDHRLSHAKPMVERYCPRIPLRFPGKLPGSAAAA